MRSILVLCVCVSVLGSVTIQTERVQESAAAIFSAEAQELLSFKPEDVAPQFELQQNQAACLGAWGQLSVALTFNASDPCTYIPLAFQNLNNPNWTDSVFAYIIDGFCNAASDMCRARYNMLYGKVITACTNFNPADASQALAMQNMTNKTDQITRLIQALLHVPCVNTSTSWTSTNFTHPLVPGMVIPAMNYTYWPCLIDFVHVIRINIDTVTANALPGLCSDCFHTIANWFNWYGYNQLAFASRQAATFCKRHPLTATTFEYCIPHIQALRVASATDSAFATKLQSGDAATTALVCNPCTAWFLEAVEGALVSLQKVNPTAVSAAMMQSIQQSAASLAVACDNDGTTPCALKLSKYTLPTLLQTFSSCLTNNGCNASLYPTPRVDPCRIAIFGIYKDVKCCIRTFLKGLVLQQPQQVGLVTNILNSCGLTNAVLPFTCSRKRITVFAPLWNTLHAWIQNHTAMLPAWFAAALAVDVTAIEAVDCWLYDATNMTSACNISLFVAADAMVADWLNTFNYSKFAGDVVLVDINSADNSAAPFVDYTSPAYDPTAFSASSENACIQSLPPVNETWNNSTGTCVDSCSDGVKDGDETDVDCGGSGCNPCATGKGCLYDVDCVPNDTCQKQICALKKNAASALVASPLVLILALFAFLL